MTETRNLRLKFGEVACEISGDAQGQPVIGIPGLSANLRSFDVIFGALDDARHRKIAFDPRGRGRSEKTPAGTYGWPAHAADIIEIADQLGAETFDVIGWSMGAWIAMVVAKTAPQRVSRVVLIDAAGLPEETIKVPVYAGLDRLADVYPSREAFLSIVRNMPHYQPFAPWERLFNYDLVEVDGGVGFRTQKAGPWEDEQYRLQQDPYALWAALTMPTLLVRASQQIPPSFGYLITPEDYARFLSEVPQSKGVEIDANHYTIGMNSDAAREISTFLHSS